MAQLKDTTINGTLDVSSGITMQAGKNLYSIHPENNNPYSLITMTTTGNTIVGYHGYVNRDSNTNIYGEDINFLVASSGAGAYRPYYRAGDTLKLGVHTCGYATNLCKDVYFYLPFARPIIGSPVVTIASERGMLLRQNDKYTHGSTTKPETTYTTPDSYTIAGDTDWNGLCIKATFSNIENAVNNSPIAVYWDGTITFS